MPISYQAIDFAKVTMIEMKARERRMDERFQARLPIYILASDGSRLGETEDISSGGAFIRCHRPPPPDEKVLLTYRNPSGNIQIVLAKVAWTKFESRGSSGKSIGMGVKFIQSLSTLRPREKSGE